MKEKFIKNETFYHKCAVETLASWIDGKIEQPFMVKDKIVFVPDVVYYKDGIIQGIYEIVHSRHLTTEEVYQYWKKHKN